MIEMYYRAVNLSWLKGNDLAMCKKHLGSGVCDQCGAEIFYAEKVLAHTREIAEAANTVLVVLCCECADKISPVIITEAYDDDLANKIANSIHEMN